VVTTPNSLHHCYISGSYHVKLNLDTYLNTRYLRYMRKLSPKYVKILFIFLISLSLILKIDLLFAQNIQFEQVPFDKGLSKKSILCMLQDSDGFMWFGTLKGLYRYDGYQFTEYLADINNPHSLSDDNIFSIFEDNSGILWISTNWGGLNKFDKKQDCFISYRHDPEDSASISSDQVLSVREDSQGHLWICTQGGGLNYFNRQTEKFTCFKHDSLNSNSLSYDDARYIYIDNNDIIWIGTEHGGLNRFNPETGQFTHYQTGAVKGHDLLSDQISVIFPDKSGKVWIGTLEGINILDPETGITSQFKAPANSCYSEKNKLWAACEDPDGNIWLGTDIGLYRYNEKQKVISYYKYEPDNPEGLIYDCVISAWADRSGLLWFGTWDGGLCKYDPQTSRFGHVKHQPGNRKSLNSNRVNVIYQDRQKNIWIGTEKGGLNKQIAGELTTESQFIHYVNDPNDPSSLNCNSITSLCEDQSGRIYIGTTEMGLSTLDPTTGKFTPFPLLNYNFKPFNINFLRTDHIGNVWIGSRNGSLMVYQPSTDNSYIFSDKNIDSYVLLNHGTNYLYQDKSGTYWIGTSKGLVSLKFKENNIFTDSLEKINHFTADPQQQNKLSNNYVRIIFEDNSGNIWIGTNNGLNKLNLKSGRITAYSKKDGLAENEINGITEDMQGNLWVSTNNGLSRFNPSTATFKNFDINDGLQSNDFRLGAVYRDHSGKLYFGGSNGYNAFYPMISEDSPAPAVVLTGFKILNQPVGINEIIENHPVMTCAINEARQINISYKSRVFSFEFSALDFRDPERNKYAYILEGFEDKWTQSGNRRFATYTNLAEGDYIFKVRAANKDGIWNNEGTEIKIHIIPPWWKTIRATIIFTALGLLILYIVFHFWKNRQLMKQQLAFEQLEAEKLHELDEMKSHFFANISHEFRTPLSLILGSTKLLKSQNTQSDSDEHYNMLIRNADRLLNLVNELMDLSKLEEGKLQLQAGCFDIKVMIDNLVQTFQPSAIEQKINLNFKSEIPAVQLWYDSGKMETIFINLISNALKFTPPGGQVDIILSVGDAVAIQISDTGRGISPEHLPNVFDRFFQASNSFVQHQQGSGIGLALTRELVHLHHGRIKAESILGKGTIITVQLPLGNQHLQEDEKVLDPSVLTRSKIEKPVFSSPESVIINSQESDTRQNNSTIILIIEDNEDMRSFIRHILTSNYKVLEAADGQKGFTMAAESIPDLIISDVMMPIMDGYQLCTKLKNDVRTSHIPVVLLTAKSSGTSKIEGLELGADDYLTKPFEPAELKVRVKNLIAQRLKLKERFGQEALLGVSNSEMRSADQTFLTRAMNILEKQLGNTDLGVEVFAKEIGLSRSQLHRKLQGLTGQSISEFIRTIRLKRAALFLKEKKMSISEIAWQVGFNNATYFHKCFRTQFGMTPAEYSDAGKHIVYPHNKKI